MTDNRRIEELRRRVRLDPASVAFAGLAEEYRKAGRFEESVATCRAGLQRHPVYVSARVTLGRSLLALGRYEEAREELKQVIRVAPENLAAIRALAEIQSRFGDRDPAASNQTAISPAAHADAAAPPSVIAVKPAAVPIRPVRLSAVTTAQTTERELPASIPPTESSALSAPTETPDTRVLQKLESFLASVVRAREMLSRGGLSQR